MTAEACNCDAKDKLDECRQSRHWLNEDLLRAQARIRELEAEVRRLELFIHQ